MKVCVFQEDVKQEQEGDRTKIETRINELFKRLDILFHYKTIPPEVRS